METSTWYLRAIAAIATIGLTGCAATGRISLPEDKRAAGTNAAVVAVVAQSQINKAFTPSNVGAAAAAGAAAVPGLGILLAAAAGAAGGAIDATVNAERAKNAEVEVLPLRTTMAEFNFDEILRAELDQELSTLVWLSATPTQILKDPAAKINAHSESASQLNLITSYFVTEDLSALTVRVTAQQMPQKAAPPAITSTSKTQQKPRTTPPQPIYRNTIIFTANLPANGSKAAADRMAAWQQGEGKVLATSVLETAADAIARELAQDINVTPDAIKKQMLDKNLADHRLKPKGIVLGKILSKSDNRIVIRHRDGSLSIIKQL